MTKRAGKNIKLIEVGMFCRVQSSNYVKHGLKRGEVVCVIGDGMLPVSDKDPYTMRKWFLGSIVDKDGNTLADETKPIMLDALDLKAVTKPLQERLDLKFEAKFSPPPVPEEVPSAVLN